MNASDIAEIRAALDEGVVVDVRSLKIGLKPPMAGQIGELRELARNHSEDDDATQLGWDLAVAAIRVCVPELAAGEAARLLAYAGGEISDLSFEALRLCGFPMNQKDGEEGGATDRPT